MFAKDKVTQSMIDAVNQVLGEEKKRLINDAEMDETGFHKAAHAAKKAGQSHFEFQGKKYPATAKSTAEAIEEGSPIKIATSTGTKVLGTRYGNSAKAHRDMMADPMTGTKGPKEKELKDIEKEKPMKEDGDCVTPPQAKDIAKKEVGKHEKGMHGKKGEVAKHVKSMHKENMSFADKLLATLKEAKNHGPQETFADNNLGEAEMTDAQMKKREKIVMSMKKGEADLKQRYGKNWKNVMYATATKQAMKEGSSDEWDGEQLDEAGPQKMDVPAYLRKQKGEKPLQLKDLKRKDTISDKENLAKARGVKEEAELSEKNNSHTHAAHYENDKGEWTGMNLLTAKDDEDAIRQAHEKCKDGCRLSRVERHIAVKEEYVDESLADLVMKAAQNKGLKAKINTKSSQERQKDTDDMLKQRRAAGQVTGIMPRGTSGKYYKNEEVEISESEVTSREGDKEIYTTDMLSGRVKGVAKLNSFKNYKSELRTNGEMKPPTEVDKGEDTKEKQKITTNPGPVDIKLDDKLTGPTPYTHFSTQEKITSEEVRGELKHIRNKEEKETNKKVKDFIKHPATKTALNKEEKDSDVPFDKPYKTMPKDVTDKSGAKHTPMSRARDLARQSFKKLKKETMMGKISN